MVRNILLSLEKWFKKSIYGKIRFVSGKNRIHKKISFFSRNQNFNTVYSCSVKISEIIAHTILEKNFVKVTLLLL